MDMMLVISFLGVAIILTIMPGPDILFVIAQSISQNKQAGIATACGLCTGLIVHILAATLGISAILYQSALAFTVIKFAGAAYLIYLAILALKEKKNSFILQDQSSKNYFSLYKKGIVMNLLNPKVSLFFLALLPQFVDKSIGFVSLQMLILGLIFFLQALIIFSVVSILAEKVRTILLKKSFLLDRLHIIKAMLFALIALQLAFSER